MNETKTIETEVKVSEQFLIKLKLNELPAYRIAQQASVNPNTLSRLINGIDPLRPGDERIIAVGQVLGLTPKKCFTVLNRFKTKKGGAE